MNMEVMNISPRTGRRLDTSDKGSTRAKPERNIITDNVIAAEFHFIVEFINYSTIDCLADGIYAHIKKTLH